MLDLLFTLDGNILLWIQEHLRGDVLNDLMVWYTHMGDGGLLWLGLSLVLLCFPRTRRAGLLALMALALGGLFTNLLLKPLVDRTRPWLIVNGLYALVGEPDPHSFPSGHTCAAFAAAGVWFRNLPGRWLGAVGLGMAALMGFSRLYVGVHYPSDVLAGALIGLFCAWLALRLAPYLPKWDKKKD